MRSVTISIFFLIICTLSSNVAFADDTFRCGKKLVSVGDTTAEVIIKCGGPSMREFTGYETRGDYKENISRGTYREISQKVEKWYYNCGRGNFIKILTFKSGILTSIEIGGRGSGQPDWKRSLPDTK